MYEVYEEHFYDEQTWALFTTFEKADAFCDKLDKHHKETYGDSCSSFGVRPWIPPEREYLVDPENIEDLEVEW